MLRVERGDNGVGRIVLDRPDARNALDHRDARRHHRRGARVPRRPARARGAAHRRRRRVLRRAWTSSASTVAQAGKPGFSTRSTSEALRAGVQTFIRELWELDKPTVAAVNGAAVGPGAHLALACDFVLVDPKHRVHVDVPEVGPRRRRRRRVPAAPPRRARPRQGDGHARRERRRAPRPSTSASRTGASTTPTRLRGDAEALAAPARVRPDAVARSVEAAAERVVRARPRRFARARRPLPGARDDLPRPRRRDGRVQGEARRALRRPMSPPRVQRVASYVVCLDEHDRLLLCRLTDVTEPTGLVDTSRRRRRVR